MAHIKQFKDLKIWLDVIKIATNNFADESCIGRGGFGSVYKGKIGNHSMVALKRSIRTRRYRVLEGGFCDDSGEKILMYPYAANESLDKHLNNDKLRWIERLKICIGAAQGLAYLHQAVGSQQRVLHRDIKSSNILLDEDWNAKISDFGLFKLGPANQKYTFLVSKAVGTLGYCDPLYVETRFLTKESDVYSFGVVLFEVFCGRFCVGNEDDTHPYLIKLARKSYEHNSIKEIVYGNLKEEIKADSLHVFATIAYKCLNRDHEDAP
ncbi:receptor-like protein kinase HERK 1 [Bidens hawaiensis]|uniref:receptor-like protein kinase HERK 1 n=1 Tax=Bidens hawaiensis TaxID=980011 RepID=UPI00404B8FD5